MLVEVCEQAGLMSNVIQKFTIDTAVKSRILEKISTFSKLNILLIGDVGVDEYVMGNVKRISPEAPVPVLEVNEEDKRLGLAANVAQNVISLGGQVKMVSVVGDDDGESSLSPAVVCAGKGGKRRFRAVPSRAAWRQRVDLVVLGDEQRACCLRIGTRKVPSKPESR